MLKGISPLISPELLTTLHRMGHGDEIVLADVHFPGESLNRKVVRADGIRMANLLNAILPLFELDSYVPNPLFMMLAEAGDSLDLELESSYRSVIDNHCRNSSPIERIDRSAFYDRTRQAFAVVMTGETSQYGNIILKKGVTPLEQN
ncbi:MAG: L-fucose mutarotase [Verrucomicrobiota bacterium]